MTTITNLTPLRLWLDTDDQGIVCWHDNPDLSVSVKAAQERHGVLSGLDNAEHGLVIVGLGIDDDDGLTEVHTQTMPRREQPELSSLSVVEQAIRALEVVAEGLRRAQAAPAAAGATA